MEKYREKKMRLQQDIVYAPHIGERGRADLFMPDSNGPFPTALVIHGGGWNAMDKSSLHPLARLFAAHGIAALCPNYRLLDTAPWPACGDDCMTAASFAMTEVPKLIGGAAGPLIIAGASAGGHLALMTGLRLPAEKVRMIISIAGPTDMNDILTDANGILKLKPETFFGRNDITPQLWAEASPLPLMRAGAPELCCIHSTRDELVPPRHSEKLCAAAWKCNVNCEIYLFEGNDNLHGCWLPTPPGTPASERQFIPDVERQLEKITARLVTGG